MGKKPNDDLWAEAQRRCRLNAETIRMAKDLQLDPRSLIKNIPSPREPWKAPVHVWIRDLYEARRERARRRPAPDPVIIPDDEWGTDTESRGESESTGKRVAEENAMMLQRQQEFRQAAGHVARAFATLPGVARVALFGSVATTLAQELPRFGEFRRRGIALLHECRDVDIAVWVDDAGALARLRDERSRALNQLFDVAGIGVAHHQVDIFIFQTGTDHHLGRLCNFGQCPKDKPECLVAGCGASPFLRQIEGFSFDPNSLAACHVMVLYVRV